MSDNPNEPRRPLGDRDESNKKLPFGARSGSREPDESRPGTSPTDPYPWAKDDEEEEPEPAADPNQLPPTAPYPWASEDAPKKPERPADPNSTDPTAPYPWAGETEAKRKPPAAPEANRTPPTAPYPWAEPDRGVAPPTPAPPPPAPARDAGRVSPTAPYPWASEPPAEKTPPPPEKNRISPTAPYPWSDEAPLEPDEADERPILPTQPQPIIPDTEGPDPSGMSWADLIAGVEGAEAAPEEADLLDEAPLEPPLASEGHLADRPRISDAKYSMPTEKEAPLERVTDRFLKRGAFFNRSSAIPSRSYLENETVPAPEPISLQVMPLLRTLGVILGSSLLISTLFTWWTPNSFLPSISAGQLAIAEATQSGETVPSAPQPTSATSNAIGIVSGHRGINPSSGLPDPGAVCADGLTEESVNATIAIKTAQLLEAAGYHVDIFDEFDPRLQGYRALAMVSIHADSCEYINDEATGFKVASFQSSTEPDRDTRLVNCMIQHYATRTGMSLHPGVTFDMTDYHNFREIDPQTPGIIVEVGFLYLDRSFLTSRPDDSAHGIVDGLQCYLHGEAPAPATAGPVTTPTPTEGVTPTPTITVTPTDFGSLFGSATPVETQVPLEELTPAP